MKPPSVRNKPLLEQQNVTRLRGGHIIQIDGCRNHSVLVLASAYPASRGLGPLGVSESRSSTSNWHFTTPSIRPRSVTCRRHHRHEPTTKPNTWILGNPHSIHPSQIRSYLSSSHHHPNHTYTVKYSTVRLRNSDELRQSKPSKNLR